MKITNKYIINIIVANLLWSFIPIVATGLFDGISIITIVVLRFLIAGVVLFFIAILLAISNNYFNKDTRIPIKEYFLSLKHKNRRFYNVRTYNYYFLIGFFGIIIHILFFFFALKTTSIPFTSIGILLTIIFVALYEKGVNFEKFDIFRILFILMLTFVIIIIISVSFRGAQLSGTPIELRGIIYLILYSITGSFLYISIERDSFSKNELRNINKNKYYKIPRALIKMSIAFISGVIILIPVLIIIVLLPYETDFTQESVKFFSDLGSLNSILFRWEILYLIIFATIIPYLLIFLANVNWKTTSLTYSQWSSILGLIDPMNTLIFAVLLSNEYFPHEYLIIIAVLLVITIALRYAHEVKNVINAYILLRIKRSSLNTLPLRILKFYGIKEIYSLMGNFDLMLKVRVNSFKDFHYLINRKIKPLNEILEVEVQFVDKIEKI
ncbi:MAG: Lrp/AsnC ligand binding domain-containing protein [Candidatus Lokiarchaeota archaeon]|nr:Lrp/AsnC ligand binding domain-containing protein [Candidatus Lokiarchaeota archaeon]